MGNQAGVGAVSNAISIGAGVASTNVFKNIYANGSLTGGSNSRTIDNVLSCSTTQTTNNLLSWTASQKVAQDSGISLSVITFPDTPVNAQRSPPVEVPELITTLAAAMPESEMFVAELNCGTLPATVGFELTTTN